MSVVPGFSGQKFMPEVLTKAKEVRKRLAKHQRLEMDGGLHNETIAAARDAGVDWFVVASAIFDHPAGPSRRPTRALNVNARRSGRQKQPPLPPHQSVLTSIDCHSDADVGYV